MLNAIVTEKRMVEMVGLILSIIVWKLISERCMIYLVRIKYLNQLMLGFENVTIAKEFLNVL